MYMYMYTLYVYQKDPKISQPFSWVPDWQKKNQLGKPQGAPTSLGHIHKIPNSELFLGVVFQVLPKEGLSNICPKQGSEKRFLIAEEQE